MGGLITLSGLVLLADVIYNFYFAATGNTFLALLISNITGLSFELVIIIQAIYIVGSLAYAVKRFMQS